MNPVEECRRKAENMLRFFAMEASEQIVFLGDLPHDHGHPRFLEDDNVNRFQMLIDNFLESDPALVTPEGEESGIERDMQYLLNREIGDSSATSLWSQQGIRKHPLWRVLRLLAREALVRAGVQATAPSVEVNELSSR